MIISTCSFGSTGSSVITDYLKEFDSINVMDAAELSWIAAVDGIIDLDFHLNNPHNRTTDSICAIERYQNLCQRKLLKFEKCGIPKAVFKKSVNEFLESITMTTWKWDLFMLTGKSQPYWRLLIIKFLDKSYFL